MSSVKRVVLAYSGGLDTSVIIRWLKEKYRCEVIAYAADLGQGEELEPLEDKALATGAAKALIEDLRGEFVDDFVFPMIRSGAVYEGGYLLGTAIARPLIAKRQIEIAEEEGADAICHGATGKGNDQVRFELAYYALNPQIKVIAPWREWDMNSRTDLISYAERYDIPVTVTKSKPYSIDRNLLHTSFEGGVLEDPWEEPDEAMFLMSVSPEDAPDQPLYICIDYKDGDPVALDGKGLSPLEILSRLNETGGKHGVGRLDLVENRFVGMKSRGVYETPGGTILHAARKGMESITMDREVMHLRDSLVQRYSELVYYGYWFSPEREALQCFMNKAAEGVTGSVRLKLYKGNCTIVGRKSDRSLYRHDLATFEQDSVYEQADAGGFIRLNALRLKTDRMIKNRFKG